MHVAQQTNRKPLDVLPRMPPGADYNFRVRPVVLPADQPDDADTKENDMLAWVIADHEPTPSDKVSASEKLARAQRVAHIAAQRKNRAAVLRGFFPQVRLTPVGLAERRVPPPAGTTRRPAGRA